ncbi:MAG: tripartite tricarboxylate transporter substrate-binding protein [Pseudomonadota bacterium]
MTPLRPARRGVLWCAALCVALVATAAGKALAEPDPLAFLRGERLTYIVATKPGGGYDAYARLIAEALERQLPDTEVIVQNVPGAGHIVGTNRLAAAVPDGLTIGMFNTGLFYAQLIEREGVAFDLAEMGWLGAAAVEPRVMIAGPSAPKGGLAALRATERVIFGTKGVGTASSAEALLLAKALDLDIVTVPGYGGDRANLGLRRGELAATVGSWSSWRGFVEEGPGTLLLAIGTSASLPEGTPQAAEFTQDAEGEALVALIQRLSRLGRLTAAPPGLPPERLDALRQVWQAALTDPAFLARAEELRLPIEPTPGAEVAALARAILALPENLKSLLVRSMGGDAS